MAAWGAESGHIAVAVQNAVAVVTLRRPDRLNALTTGMRRELAAILRHFGGGGQVRGIVVTGTAQLTDYRLVGVGLIGANRPLLLGGAPEQMADLTSLQLFGRTLGWFGTLDGRTIAVTGVDRYERALSALSDDVD